MNQEIINFYLNIDMDGNTPTYDKVMRADHDWLEHSHNWCQRAFPNFEASELVAGAPVLDDKTLLWLSRTQIEKVLHLTFKYLNHFGAISEEHEFPHNNRRITRLIKFLKMLDLYYVKLVVYRVAMSSMDINPDSIGSRTYWFDALNYKREKE